jgi:excisionase family DNA binding protein
MEKMLTATEVAELLQVHLKTVYRLARNGLIPGKKLGGGWRFSRDEIVKMVSKEERRESAEAA